MNENQNGNIMLSGSEFLYKHWLLLKKATGSRLFAIVTYRTFRYDQRNTSPSLFYNVRLYVLIHINQVILCGSFKVIKKVFLSLKSFFESNYMSLVDLYLRFEVNEDWCQYLNLRSLKKTKFYRFRMFVQLSPLHHQLGVGIFVASESKANKPIFSDFCKYCKCNIFMTRKQKETCWDKYKNQ